MENSSTNIAEQRSGRRRRILKIAAVCVLQLFAIFLLAESIVRVGGFDRPLAGAVSFGGSDDPLHQTDRHLFYRLRPNLQTVWQGAEVTTNSLGLRGAEVEEKGPREYRILSLGESSTFGAMVADDETYSACLERHLQEQDDNRTYRVINAGVCGYSSFQSLKYLEHRGLKLNPDLVLFYHEINDALPVTVSDEQRYAASHEAWHRGLADWSAAYRALSAYVMERRHKQRPSRQDSPGDGAALADDRAVEPAGDGDARTDRVPRVSRQQRREILAQLTHLCRANGVTLVFIHPAYAESTRHTCELTEFCEQTGTLLFEAHDCLHPPGARQREFFADECHPNQEGHERLSTGLFQFLKPIVTQ